MLGHEGAEEESEEMVEAAHVCGQVAAQMSRQVDAALAELCAAQEEMGVISSLRKRR